VPKQNRPLVRDGRLQAKKKRTDRSYLRPNGAGRVAVAEEPEAAVPPTEAEEAAEAQAPSEEMSVGEADAVEAATGRPAAASMTPEAAPVRAGATRLPTTVRALQQQGVRKRREFDVHALAIRDTNYAIHEMRRIAILSVMVIVTLIVLGVVMR
jgi:hypothetical protein